MALFQAMDARARLVDKSPLLDLIDSVVKGSSRSLAPRPVAVARPAPVAQPDVTPLLASLASLPFDLSKLTAIPAPLAVITPHGADRICPVYEDIIK